MADYPKVSIAAYAAISSVAILYLTLKLPLKYKFAKDSRISPKSDLAWRNSAQKWLDNH